MKSKSGANALHRIVLGVLVIIGVAGLAWLGAASPVSAADPTPSALARIVMTNDPLAGVAGLIPSSTPKASVWVDNDTGASLKFWVISSGKGWKTYSKTAEQAFYGTFKAGDYVYEGKGKCAGTPFDKFYLFHFTQGSWLVTWSCV
jgi:hypothetical protein